MPDWMTARIVYYNIILVCLNASLVWFLSRRPSLKRLIIATLALGIGGSIAAALFTTGGFCTLTYLSFAIFIYLPILLVAASVALRGRLPKTALAIFCSALLVVATGIDAFFIEPHWLEVSHVTFSSPKIERPLRIVFIADFQTDNISAYEEEFLRLALAEKPDIILFGGDYLQVRRERWAALSKETNRLLQDVELQAPAGVFAVQGNIDRITPWPLIFAGLPVTIVSATESFDVAGIRLTCLSLSDSRNQNLTLPKPVDNRTDTDSEKSSPFHVVLGHLPDYAMSQIPADLLLAGHTHGGQVQLPALGPIMTMSKVPRSWASGITDLPHGGRLLVSRGVGMERHGSPRLRFLCRPELVVIDLLPEKSTE